MPVFEIGVSHHHVDSDQLSALAQCARDLPEALLGSEAGIDGVVVLATCNRFEVYVDAHSFHPAVDSVRTALASSADGVPAELMDSLVLHAGQGAVEHLFQVCSGLDSMVIGEAEIAGQVRDALAAADATATPPLRRLFQDALTASKAVATHTNLGAAGRSLASVGLDLVDTRHGGLSTRNVLIIGTGAYARVVTAELLRRGSERLKVYSATGRAEAFAATHATEPVALDDLADALAWADVVVCSGGQGASLTADLVADARRGSVTVLPVLDLSITGGIDPDAADLVQVDVIDLGEIGHFAPSQQVSSVLAAHDIVRRGVETYLHVEEGRTAVPAVTAMRSHVMAIIEREIESARRRHTPETADAVARSLRRVSNSLLHTPSVRAAELARTGGLDDYRNALRTLFGVDVDAHP